MKPMHTQEEGQNASLLAKDQYMREVRWLEMSEGEEEQKMIERLVRGNLEKGKAHPNQWVLSLAKHARECLVERYQPLVISIARRYAGICSGLDFLDLVQEGNIGLLHALDSLEYAEVKQACVLVQVRVRGFIVEALRDRGGLIRVQRGIADLLAKKRRVERELLKVLGREPLLSEVAEKMGVPVDRLSNAVDLAQSVKFVDSLQQVFSDDEGEEEERGSLESLYHSPYAQETDHARELENVVQQAVERSLTKRQRELIRLRYGVGGGIGGGYTHMEIAEVFGVRHRVTIEVTEKRAKSRLQRALAPLYGLSQQDLPA